MGDMPQMRNRSLVDHVADEVRQMILAGEIAPGEFLPPRKDLAAEFDVGLSTVNEAIQALTAVGLLSSRAGKGTWVREDALDLLIPPSMVRNRLGELNARQLAEARSVIEVALAEFAARRATPEDLTRIRKALQAMRDAVDDDEVFVEADLAFHVAVAQAAHNDILEQFYHLSRRLLSEVIAELVRMSHVKREGIRLQGEIAQAIADHDVERARRATLEHMAVIDGLIEQGKRVE
jgi:GntR family transcriptional repressor for pyruvate dehydrogenase complex